MRVFNFWEKKTRDTFNDFLKENYSEEKTNSVFENEEQIKSRFNTKTLGKFLGDAKTFFAMLKDYASKKYPIIPVKTLVAIVSTLLYVLLPIDVIPDFIPGIGYLDDALMMGLCLKFCHDDVESYKKWQDDQYVNVTK